MNAASKKSLLLHLNLGSKIDHITIDVTIGTPIWESHSSFEGSRTGYMSKETKDEPSSGKVDLGTGRHTFG